MWLYLLGCPGRPVTSLASDTKDITSTEAEQEQGRIRAGSGQEKDRSRARAGQEHGKSMRGARAGHEQEPNHSPIQNFISVWGET